MCFGLISLKGGTLLATTLSEGLMLMEFIDGKQCHQDAVLEDMLLMEELRTAERIWETKIWEWHLSHTDHSSFATIGAGIYIRHLPIGRRTPKPKRILTVPLFYPDIIVSVESGPEIATYLQEKGIDCWCDQGIDD